jgi:hypothetical protein
MDQVWTDDATHEGVDSRRSLMRTVARSRRKVAAPTPEHFQTPAWLERSFVLPLTKPEQTDLPEPRPHHDPIPQQSMPRAELSTARVGAEGVGTPEMSAENNQAGDLPLPAPAFVRPPSDDIDFGTVIRRADRSRSALRTAWASTGVAGLVLIAFLLTTVPALAVIAAVSAMVAVGATVVRMRLMRAPVPRVNR